MKATSFVRAVAAVLSLAAAGRPQAQSPTPVQPPGSGDFLAPGEAGGTFAGARKPAYAVDYDAFLKRFDARELLQQIKGDLLGGAQSAVTNYLLALAYASPTTASILDMAEHKYSARHAGLAIGEIGRSTRSSSPNRAERRLALIQAQCFNSRLDDGDSPTAAWRRCNIDNDFQSKDASAAESNASFLKNHVRGGAGADLLALAALLPDERMQGGQVQTSSPGLTIDTLASRLQQKSEAALRRIESGTDPGSISACRIEDLASATVSGPDCIPRRALEIIRSGAYRSARLLPPAVLDVLRSDLSSQAASAGAFDAVVELAHRIGEIDWTAEVDAQEGSARRQDMEESLHRLLELAQSRIRLGEERGKLTQSLLRAMDEIERRLDAGARATTDASQRPGALSAPLVRLYTPPR